MEDDPAVTFSGGVLRRRCDQCDRGHVVICGTVRNREGGQVIPLTEAMGYNQVCGGGAMGCVIMVIVGMFSHGNGIEDRYGVAATGRDSKHGWNRRRHSGCIG